MTKVFILNGRLEHVGDWDYQPYNVDVADNPWPGPGDAPFTWDHMWRIEEHIGNPLPEGIVEADREITTSAKGRKLLADDWYNLREDAYPPIKDQLDAMWKGGEEAQKMSERVQTVKDMYPKPE